MRPMNKRFYLRLWHWHFFAALYVLPFILLLSLTGLVMLFGPWLDDWQFGEELTQSQTIIAAEGMSAGVEKWQRVSPDKQRVEVQKTFPSLYTYQFIPPLSPEQTSIFKVRDANYVTQWVFVDPYTGKVQGHFANDDRWYSVAADLHRNMMLGKIGGGFIEIAVGLMLLLVILGLSMALLKRPAFNKRLVIKSSKQRSFWLKLHIQLGLFCSLVILFYGLSGMTLTGTWGQKLVKPYSSFPVEKYAYSWPSNLNEANKGASWSLEQVMKQAKALGFSLEDGNRYRIALPLQPTGVYTLMSIASSRDVLSPAQDRTIHIDRYSGEVLADIGWEDYSFQAKTMAAIIPLHFSTLGWWNLVIAIIVCLGLLLMALTGTIMWYKRRRKSRRFSLSAPIRVELKLATLSFAEKALLVAYGLIALIFPLSALFIAVLFLLTRLTRRFFN
mgnify:FL=1